MIDFGTVRPGTTLYIPFATYDSNDPSASVTITGLATTDIELYKDGGTTARASDAGYALLGTDGIDEYGTGIHGISVDLADNTTANFYESGSQYWVVVASITVDAATINFVAATFRIGYPDAVLNTVIATLASQTSFTLEEGPADDDALNGMPCVIHDLASAVQVAKGIISDYTGSTKTVTLDTDPGIFTMAAGDNFAVFIGDAMNPTARANIETAGDNYSATRGLAGTALPAAAADAAGGLPISDAGGLDLDAQIGTDIDAILVDTSTTLPAEHAALPTAAENRAEMDSNSTQLAAIVADTNELQTDNVPGLIAALNDPTAAAIADAVLDEALSGHVGAGSLGKAVADIETDATAILADTNELQGDWTDGGRLDLLIDAIKTVTDAIPDSGAMSSIAQASALATVDTVVDAIKVITDALGATAAANLALSAGASGIVTGAAEAGTLSTTQMTSDLAEATDDHYIGRVVLWTSGVLDGQASDITDYTGATGMLTYTAVTEAPSAADTFIII